MQQTCNLRFLVNHSLLSDGSFISIHFHQNDLFLADSLLVRCVCVSAGVPVRGAAAWLHWTAGVLSRLAHQHCRVAPAQNRTKLSQIHDDSQRCSHNTRLRTFLVLVKISTFQNAQELHYSIVRFSIMSKL